jgi:hypothetical protein
MQHSAMFLSVLCIMFSISCQGKQAVVTVSRGNQPLVDEPVTVKQQKPGYAESKKQADPDPVEEELKKCAKYLGGEWLSSIKSLEGIRLEIGSILQLSDNAKDKIKVISVAGNCEVIPDLTFLKALEYLDVTSCSVKNITRIEGLLIETLQLSDNPLTAIDALSNCVGLKSVNLSNVITIEYLPELSQLLKLNSIGLSESSIVTLDNIDTVPGSFKLYLLNCEKLVNIDALANSHIKTLIIDKKTYERFGVWFDANLAKLKERNPGFEVLFKMPSGL